MSENYDKLVKEISELRKDLSEVIVEMDSLRKKIEEIEEIYVGGGVFLEGCSDVSKTYIERVSGIENTKEGTKK